MLFDKHAAAELIENKKMRVPSSGFEMWIFGPGPNMLGPGPNDLGPGPKSTFQVQTRVPSFSYFQSTLQRHVFQARVLIFLTKVFLTNAIGVQTYKRDADYDSDRDYNYNKQKTYGQGRYSHS